MTKSLANPFNMMDISGKDLQGKSGAIVFIERRKLAHSMKGTADRYWWLTVFLMLFTTECSNATQCTGSSFEVLGVFDDSDTASIRVFRNTLEDLDKVVKEPGCPNKVKHRELLLHSEMSAMEVINATRHALSGKSICYIIYSSSRSTGRLAIDYVLNSGIPVVSTIPKKVYNSRYEHRQYLYEPAKVIALNERSARLTKVQVILDVLTKFKYKEFVVITGADFDDISVVSLLRQELSQRNLVMVDWFIIPNGSHGDIIHLAEMKLRSLKSDITTFMIITNDMLLAEIIFYASKLTKERGLGPNEYYWVLQTDMDLDVVRSTSFPKTIFAIYPRISQELNNTDYVEDAITMLRYLMKEWNFDSSGRCLSIGEIQRHLPKIAFPGKTGHLVKFNEERQRTHDMYDISIIIPKEPPEIIPLGNWVSGNLNITDINPQVVVKVMVIEYAPYIMTQPKISPDEPCKSNALSCFRVVKTTKGEERHERCCYGFVIDVLQMVASQLRFTPILVFNDDGIYGIQESNGSWNGIVNDIMTGKADMSPDLFPTSRRAKVLDFTEPYMPSGIALLVKESKRQQKKIYWTSYMRPFTATLWYVVLGSVGVMIAFLWIADKVSPSRTDKKIFHWHAAFCLDNAVCYVLQLAFGRPADEKKPRTNGARLSSVLFGLAMMILIASYSANLAVFLIVNDMTTPVDSIRDKKIGNPPPDFKYGTLEGSYMDAFFKKSGNAYFRKIWHIMEKENVKNLSEGVQKVRSGELDVFIGDTVSLQYEALNDPYCELKVVGEPFAMSGASFAVKKGSRWLAPLSVALRSLKSKGLTDFIQKFWVKKFTCDREAPPVQLHFEDLSGLFLQLLIAILICVLGTFCYFGMQHMHSDYRKCKSGKKLEKEEDLEFRMDTFVPEVELLKETNI